MLSSARTARHARPKPGRARSLAAAAACLASVLTVPLVATPTASASTVDPCGSAAAWAPELRAVVITQGSNTEPPLVRGKTTIVRLFLNARSCAPAGSVRLVAASLQPFDGGTPLTDPIPTTPSALGPTYPVFDPITLPISPENQANPLFQVPRLGATSATTGEFVVQFKASLTYEYSLSPTDVRTATTVYSTQPGTTDPISVSVAPKSNALRVLLIPMGDGGGVAGTPPASQFPMASNGGKPVNGQYADQTVQKGMESLARLLPVKDGIGDLTSTTAGLRYRLDTAGMLDLSPLRDSLGNPVLSSDGTFCGNALKSSSIYEALATRLSAWNRNNKDAQADRVVGVIWQGVSKGVVCAEGFANMQGSQAWIRTFADRLPEPSTEVLSVRNAGVSMTGPLLGMELGHTLGSVPQDDPRRSHGPHSKNVAADPGHTLASYNVHLAKWLAGPLSVMRYSGDSAGYTDATAGPNSWNNDSTLVEREDYRYDQCVLTPGMTTSQCPFNGTTIGSVGGAAQGDAFVLAGTADELVTGAGFTSSLVQLTPEEGVVATAPDPTSDFRLVQRDDAGHVLDHELAVQGIPVRFGASEHTSTSEGATLTVGSVNAALLAAPGVAHIEIWKGAPGAKCLPYERPTGCLYARSARSQPVVTGTTGSSRLSEPVDVSNAAGDETGAALSPDATVVAWSSGSPAKLVLQQRDTSANGVVGAPVETGVEGFDATFSHDGKKLAFVNANGDIYVADVTFTDGQVTGLGSPQQVYNRRLQVQPPVGTAAARHPSFNADATRLAAEINGGIWVMGNVADTLDQVKCDLAAYNVTLTCEPLVRQGGNPSWRWAAAPNGLVAYEAGDGIRTLNPDQSPKPLPGSEYETTLRVPGGRSPAWGSNLLVYRDEQGVSIADSRDEAQDRTWLSSTRLTSVTADALPSLSLDERAVAFDRATAANGRDVFVGVRTDDSDVIRFEAITNDDPSLLRADVLMSCGNGFDPVLTVLHPDATAPAGDGVPAQASFSFRYSDRGACPGGVLYASVNNGYDVSGRTPVRHVPSDPTVVAPVLPSPAIGAPSPGSTYLQYDSVIATASSILPTGTNPEGAALTWRLNGPSGSGYDGSVVQTPPGASCSASLCLQPRVPGGWTPGRYDLTVTATVPHGSGTLTGTTSTYFLVLPDPEHAGRLVDVKFDPETLFVPSNGNDVKIIVTPRGADLAKVDPATIRLSEVGNHPTSIPLSGRWSALDDGSGRWQAKFSRQTLTCEMSRAGTASGYVRIALTGTGPGFSIRGFDPLHPIATPASPPATC